MTEIINIIKELQSNASRKFKEEKLLENKDNNLLKEILYFTYNPYITTGISDKKINKRINSLIIDKNYWELDIYGLMAYLQINNSGRDMDILVVQNFLSTFDEETKKILTAIITKSLTIGATAETINKIWPQLIPSFKVMLAHKYQDYEHKVTGEFILTEKYDGIRAIAIKANGMVRFFSRQGQLIEGLDDIIDEVTTMLNDADNVVLEGELLLSNDNHYASDDLYRETVKIVRKKGIKRNVIYHIFDYLPLVDFQMGYCPTFCYKRKSMLAHKISAHTFNWLKEVPILYYGKDKSIIPELLDAITSAGKEGLMLNIADAPYECKRSQGILKIKKMQSADLLIVGFEKGTGKNKDTLGRLNVDYKGYVVGVGSGLTDEMRNEIWNNQSSYLGRIAEIKYFEESSNQEGGISLRFPIFKTIREDKEAPSYN